MTGINLTTLILIAIFAILVASFLLSWRKKAALKPNLAQERHETEADILEDREK